MVEALLRRGYQFDGNFLFDAIDDDKVSDSVWLLNELRWLAINAEAQYQALLSEANLACDLWASDDGPVESSGDDEYNGSY